jgi:hypothetical protein
MLRPWRAKIVEENGTTLGRFVIEDRCAADRALGIRGGVTIGLGPIR